MSAQRHSSRRRTPAALGTVEQLPSGTWRAFYRVDGRRFSAPRPFPTKDDANAWLATERADRVRGTWRDPHAGQVTLAEYAATWLDARPDLAPRTHDLYRRTLNRWVLPRLGDGRGIELGPKLIGDLTTTLVRAWYAAMFTTARARASAQRTRSIGGLAHPARAWAREQGIAVSSSGRLSPRLLTAWAAAGEPEAPSEPIPAPTDAGRTAAAHAYRLLHAILNTAVRDGALPSNPCQIPTAGVVHHPERPTATPAEVDQLTALMPPDLAAAVVLAAWSGLRYGELFALARRHVNIDRSTLRVERALICVPGQPITFGRPKTVKSERTVHLPAFVAECLDAHMETHTPKHPDALVFSMNGGGAVTNLRLSYVFRRVRTAIGRDDLTWHDLRHTGATLAYRAGASVPDVQARLGHTTMRAASIYAHRTDESDRVLAERLDELFRMESTPPRLRTV